MYCQAGRLAVRIGLIARLFIFFKASAMKRRKDKRIVK